MNILMIATEKLPVPPVLGGAIQTYISGCLPHLTKPFNITVLGITDPSLPNEEVQDGIKYVRVPGKLLELYQQGIVQFLSTHSFDIIHIFNRPRLVMPIRRVAPQSKLILSMHNDMFNLDKIEPDEALAAINEVSMIITISNYVGNVIRNLYPAASSKLRTIYSGVDSERFLPGHHPKIQAIRNRLRQEHGLEGKKVILFAGRLSENKGVDRLIRALPLLSRKFNDLALVVVGGNWFSQNQVTDYVAYIRSLAKQQSVPVVTTGFVSPAEIQNWYAAADLFVCTSLWQEPLARVHYEAMAAGLPIVTTARGGNPEVINLGENGLIVDNPEDPANFADKVSELLSNKSLMQRMSQSGRELAVSKYNWSRVAQEITEVWSLVLQMALPSPLPEGYVAPEIESFQTTIPVPNVPVTPVRTEPIISIQSTPLIPVRTEPIISIQSAPLIPVRTEPILPVQNDPREIQVSEVDRPKKRFTGELRDYGNGRYKEICKMNYNGKEYKGVVLDRNRPNRYRKKGSLRSP